MMQGFAALRHLTVGDFRDWLLDATDTAAVAGRPRHHPGDGGGGQYADAQSGSDPAASKARW